MSVYFSNSLHFRGTFIFLDLTLICWPANDSVYGSELYTDNWYTSAYSSQVFNFPPGERFGIMNIRGSSTPTLRGDSFNDVLIYLFQKILIH